VSSLLRFNSSRLSAISISSSGVMTLHSNYFSSVIIAAEGLCQPIVNSNAATEYSNLVPEPYDVDLGSISGPPFGTVEAGSTFEVPVRIQGNGVNDVTSFQILVTFDAYHIRVSSDKQCVQGNEWSSSWICTTNDPVNEVLIVGSCGSSNCGSKGTTTVATITFNAISPGITFISGTIIVMADSVTAVRNVSIFAGSDYAHIVSNSMLTLFPEKYTADSALWGSELSGLVMYRNFNRPVARELSAIAELTASSCNTCLYGDVNGDCVFDALDVTAVQRIVANITIYHTLSPCAMRAANPDLNGVIDGKDIQYILYVVGKQYRFVTSITIDNSSSPITFSSTLHDSDQSLSSRSVAVLYDFETKVNARSNFVVGTNVTLTSVGVRATAVQETFGVYSVRFQQLYHENNLGVVMIYQTQDALGRSSSTRLFSFYCSPYVAACVSVYGV